MLKINVLACTALLAISSSLFPSSKGYEVVEDKATLPLLNPAFSERKVAKLKLDNGLQVYLISDPGLDQSAAAVAVEAGSWQDPKEYPGTAHFLEHMLFMGTATYPKEFEYMQYISDNGGSVNASTWPDRTIYMFSINNDAFTGALDRFSHFFIDPLLSPSSIDRELHAVDQEHSKNVENDGYRQYMVFKETGNTAHPIVSFSTGNAATLSGIPQSALRQWYQSHYSANRMHLILLSPLPLDEQIKLVLADFSKVPNYQITETALEMPMTSEKQRGHMIYLKPIKDLKILSLAWEIPRALAEDQDRWAPQVTAYALGNEGEGSLIALLKKEKLAEAINVTPDRYSTDEILFSIDINLTEQGVSQIDTVIAQTFQAIARLKEGGIPPYIFEDVQRTAEIQYEYQSRDDAFDLISKHAHDIVDESLSTYPEKTQVPTKYDPEFISDFIDTLTPQSCLFFVMADPAKTKVTPDKKEKWMGVEYAIKEIPQRELVAWAQSAPSDQIQLPAINPFIPTQLKLVNANAEESSSLVPDLLLDDEGAQVYFAKDARYLLPQVTTIFGFKSPSLDGSAKSVALTDLYLKALSEKLSSPLFFAKSAGLDASFSQKDLKIMIAVDGFSDKAPLLLKDIFQALKTATFTKSQFEIYKQSLQSSYENASKDLPVIQAMALLSSVITNDSPTAVEKLKALKNISYEDFLKFSKALCQKGYLQGMIYGNLKEAQAKSLVSELRASIGYMPYPPSEQLTKKVLLLNPNEGPHMLSEKTDRQGNGIVLLIEEGPLSFEKRAANQVLSMVLQDGFFDTLRTKQQTAYIAKAWDSELERQLLQYFAVQSSTHQPRDLLARFELFLEDFNKNFTDKIPVDRFENMRKMLIITLEMPPENMQGMTALLNTLAFTYNGDFSWIQKRVKSVQELTYEQLQEASQEFFSRKNTRRLAVLVEGKQSAENAFQYHPISKDKVADLGSYVSWK